MKNINNICLSIFLFIFICSNVYAANPKKSFKKGLTYTKKNKYKKAEKHFKKVIKLSLGHYPSYYNLSRNALLAKNYSYALEYLTETKRYNPFDLRADKMLASANLMQKKYPKAKAVILQMLAKKPEDIDARKKISLIYIKEGNFDIALGELTTSGNLSPEDINNTLLLSAAYALKNKYLLALEKINPLKDKLIYKQDRAFYALLLEKNNQIEASQILFGNLKKINKEKIIDDLLFFLQEKTILEEAARLPILEEYKNPEVSKRIAEKIKKEGLPTPAETEAQKAKEARPFGITGTLTQTLEHYQRNPRASNPINGVNAKTNLEIKGKTSQDIEFTGEWEGFHNRWDDTKFDYYKVNVEKNNTYEVDLGKFSAKHFPSLVSYPTVLNGVRVWKKLHQPEFEPTLSPDVEGPLDEPINLGEMYRKNRLDNRWFSESQVIAVIGKTKEPINLNARKEGNESTLDTSGQREQWTQSYRVISKVGIVETGVSASMTRDIVDSAEVSATTLPKESIATGFDMALELFDEDLTLDFEMAHSNYDEDTTDPVAKHKRNYGWIIGSEYKLLDTATLSYDMKLIERNFEVEGASQTEDKLTHEMELEYKPKNPKNWLIKEQTFKFKPEILDRDGSETDKKHYRTFQSITDFKLPQDAEYTFDYKYYRERDKCDCADYRTITTKNSLDWDIEGWKTSIKPEYTFERKNDMLASATDEKKNEYKFTVENTSFENWTLESAWEYERKKYDGATTKSYSQFIHTFEVEYDIIPSRCDVTFKASQDFKNPSDTNKTDIATLSLDFSYTSKSGDDKFEIKYERKNNIYMPWSDSSSYRQNYIKFKYTHDF